METFDLPVDHKGTELFFPARLLQFGYTYRIEVDVDQTTIVFDRDEERNWRAIIDPNAKFPAIDNSLIQAIYKSIQSISS